MADLTPQDRKDIAQKLIDEFKTAAQTGISESEMVKRVRESVEAGADLSHQDQYTDSALDAAIQAGFNVAAKQMVEAILADDDVLSPLNKYRLLDNAFGEAKTKDMKDYIEDKWKDLARQTHRDGSTPQNMSPFKF